MAPYADGARNVALAHTVLDLSYNEADLAKAIASEGTSLPSGRLGAAYSGCRAEDGGDRRGVRRDFAPRSTRLERP